jgi:hypothetical protein
MEFAEARIKIVELKDELAEFESEYKDLYKKDNEIRKKMRLCESKKKELSKEIKGLEKIIETENIFESVQGVEGFETLLQEELVAISNGMDKTDYKNMEIVRARSKAEIPRWLDLERLVKEVIAFKKLYPGWILERIASCGQYDTLPPQIFYKYTYKTPQGHYMSFGGIEVLS